MQLTSITSSKVTTHLAVQVRLTDTAYLCFSLILAYSVCDIKSDDLLNHYYR